ncbi:hypothetical protein, partial [Burkholderia pseudomallei]|uniref:hypothetical protein n=1 Tax=Burkholderia pseudomallei TaxID=28450 RepID=UPI001AAF3F96
FFAGAVWWAASALPGRGVVARRAACLPASAPLGRHGPAVTAIGRLGLRHRRGFGASGRAHRRSALARVGSMRRYGGLGWADPLRTLET